MRDLTKAIAGLAVFVVLVTAPIWYTVGSPDSRTAPDPQLPAGGGRCVEGKEWMVANHADLLRQWRDAVVRQGEKEYISKAFGTRHEMNFSKTCLGCHGDRQRFCDRCHNYADVQLTCWNCHLEPRGR